MPIQPESDDLDRTDELPQLDVVAYESTLRARAVAATADREADALATTDTWLVESVRDADADATSVRLPQQVRPVRPVISGSADLSINDRLHQRIAALEADVAAARAANADLETQRQSIGANRSELEARISALEADNARLGEQHLISQELVQRLQTQLRDQAQQHQRLLEEISAARESDRVAAEQHRVSLEQQLEHASASFSTTADEHDRLKLALDEALALAAQRARKADELQRALIEEHSKADTLGRNLAAKLADIDVMSSTVAQRNAMIAALERVRDDLRAQIEVAGADAKKLAGELDRARSAAQDVQRYASEIADRDEKIAELNTRVDQLTRDLREAGAAHQQTQQALQDALTQATADRERHEQLARELEEARAALVSMTNERDELRAARDQLVSHDEEVATLASELATVRSDALAVWTELQTQSGLASSRQQDLADVQRRLATVGQERDELLQALQETQRNIERLVAVSQDDTQLLNERTAQLATARSELEAQLAAVRGLEHSLRARDTLIDDLRGEIRIAQDERAIMQEQLMKARARVKSMTQQIFNRDNRIAVLKADLAVHTEALAAIRRDVDSIDPAAPRPEEPPQRVLEPVNHEGDAIVLSQRVMTIGRTNDNDIFIPSKMISRHHARLLVGPNAVIVEDAGSTNGCYVNGQEVKQHVLHEGDELTIGDLKFRLQVRAPAAAEGSTP